nr:unnamed protein product [Haemonchus contortus]
MCIQETTSPTGQLYKEKPWLLQATANSILYILMLAAFHIADLFEGATTRFLLAQCSWQLWLVSTPCIIIALEREFRAPLLNLWKKRVNVGVFQTFQSHAKSGDGVVVYHTRMVLRSNP